MTREFTSVLSALSAEPGVTTGKMFGAEGLKIQQRVFAMEVKAKLVVKLPQERAAELCASGAAEPFDPGHGRPMKQWVTVSKRANVDWLQLSREALRYVSGAKSPRLTTKR
jgi:TfoX/Sxy family transcriptional regulator of competence genes